MIAGEPVQRPVSRDDVWVVVAATNRLCITLLPTRPRCPIQFWVVFKPGQVDRRIVEETLAHAILVRSILVLNAAPENVIDKRFVLADLFFVGLAKLFHDGGQP